MNQTQTEICSPDVAIQKTCLFDVDFAQQLVDNKSITKKDRDHLRRMLKERIKGNELDTQYKLGKYCKHEFLGRWCAVRGFGLQNIQHDIRAALSKKYYIDIDMVNAQPTLLIQYCDARGWSCEALKHYGSNREELLQEICDMNAIKRWEAKQRVVSILFGANANDMPTFFHQQLYPEIRRITTNIWNEHATSLKWLSKQPNHMGKGLSYVLQTEERKCLLAMERALAKRGRMLDVYIHDGGLVRKNGDETTFEPVFLQELEKDIKIDTGYAIKLAVKPIETSFVLKSEPESEYDQMKKEFEETYMKLMTPAVYVRLEGNDVLPISQSTLIHQQQNKLLEDRSSFIGKWTKDPNIRTYERLVYAPKKEVRDNEYNLFTKFAVDPQPVVDISHVLTLVSLVCNHEVKVIEYFLNCMAHIIQKPYEKLRMCIIIQGNEGVGKDMILNFIGKILGSGYFFSTCSPETNVFHSFNSGTERALLVKFEEADFSTNKQNANKLKGIITKEKETYIRKGQDGIELDDYRNFIMTTNQEIPVLLENTSRRFVLIKASSDKMGDTDFWADMYSKLDTVDIQAQFHQFLLDRDITNFNAQRDAVITDYHRDTKQSLAPYHARFFQEIIQCREEYDESYCIDYKASNLYNLMKDSNTKFELNAKQFGTSMKMYVENGCILKKKNNAGAIYSVYPSLCKQFLISKDWWVEL